MSDRKNGLTYADAGVDIDAGERLVDAIKPLAKSTARPGAEASLGGFGAPTFILGRQLREDVFLTVETGIAALLGTDENVLKSWTIRLDWTFDEQSRLRLALEPVYRGRSLRSSTLALPLSEPRPQFLIEVRRRWTY